MKWQRKLIPVSAPSYQLLSMTPGLVRVCGVVAKCLIQMSKFMVGGSVLTHSFRGFSPWRQSAAEQSILHNGGQEAEWSHDKKGPGQNAVSRMCPRDLFPLSARPQLPPFYYLPVIYSYFSSFFHHSKCPIIGG